MADPRYPAFSFTPSPQQQPLTGGGQQAYANTGASALTQGMQNVADALKKRGPLNRSPYGLNTSSPYYGGSGGVNPGVPASGGNILDRSSAASMYGGPPATPTPAPAAAPTASAIPQNMQASLPPSTALPPSATPTPQPQGFQPPAGGAPMPPVRPTTGAFAQPGPSPYGALPNASAFNSASPTPPSTPVTGASPNAAFGALPNANTFGSSAPAAPGGPTPAMLQAARGAMPQMTMPPSGQANPLQMGGLFGPSFGGWG